MIQVVVCIGLMIINGLKMSQGEITLKMQTKSQSTFDCRFFRLNYWWMPCMMVSQRYLNFVITKDAKPASTPYFPLKINPLGEFSPSLRGGGSKSWRTMEFMNLFKHATSETHTSRRKLG